MTTPREMSATAIFLVLALFVCAAVGVALVIGRVL